MRALPLVASGVAICLGTLVLIGWAFGLERLKRGAPGFVAMNPATAVLFLLTGISFGMTIGLRDSKFARVTAKVLAGVVAILAGVEVVELTGLWRSPIDEILFADQLWDPQNGIQNAMAPNTALNFVLAGLAIMKLDLSGRSLFSQALAIVIGFVGLVSLTGYIYGDRSLAGLAAFIPMTVHTSGAFIVLAGGLLFAVPHASLIEPFATDDPRGVLARRLFPLAVLLTLSLGWVCAFGVRHYLFDDVFGIALYAISLSIFIVILVRWTVTVVGKLEAERAAINARLHELNRRKDEMIAVVSHDLCSPLTGFRMVIDLLRERKEEPTEELLGLMDQSARRMVSMVRGLLNISKLQSDTVELELEDMRLSEVIRHTMQPLVINANAKHIALNFHPPVQEPVLRADRLRVSQIFSNLLTNAVKFTAPGGAVDVTIEPKKEVVNVHVRDTGLGIPKEEMPHIFDKYRQTATKATAGENGAGLGLAIVREMVLLHGGQITVSSEVNRGSVFSVCLPINPGEQQEKAA
ncbi:MAG TPA: HAMP domain-containing sensor histidine kinase [Verrucomicrobiae bacterium]|nr:HAMP domain-containing sensor histidine kinase [Verrucomicrobiae bacterium]